MAGIPIGSSFRLTSPQPHLTNASFADAPARLAQGQLRHVSWRYSQDNPDAHYRIKPLAICFLADGITPAVQFDSWGTLEAHWRIMPVVSGDLPEGGGNLYYTEARVSARLLALQAPIVIIQADGTTTYTSVFPTSDLTLPGAQIRVRGAVTIAADLTGLNASLVLEAGAVLTFNRMTVSSFGTDNDNRVTISGAGTLRGNINLYISTPALRLHITGIRHEGMFINDSGNNLLMADVRWSNVACVPPVGYPYLNTMSRNYVAGGCFYFRYRFYQCRFTVSGISPAATAYTNVLPNTIASAFQLSAFNYTVGSTSPTDAADKANSLLEAVGCTFIGDGTSSNKVLTTLGGYATYRFANNTVFGITAPTDASDPAFTAFGIGTGGGNSTSPLATTSVAGIVKIGTGISVTSDGTISAAAGTAFPDTLLGDYDSFNNLPALNILGTGIAKGSYYRLTSTYGTISKTTVNNTLGANPVLADYSGLLVGMNVTGPGVPANAYVIGISAISLGISDNITDGTCPAGSVLTFSKSFLGFNSSVAGDFLYWNGSAWIIRALNRVGGVFRGAFTASTVYAKNDSVLQAGISYYALSSFTSAASFVALNWSVIPGQSSSAFTAITANQYGTHPAFSTQTALNAYLLGGTATAPAPTTSAASFTAS